MSQKKSGSNIYYEGGSAYITKWTCDVCQVRAFDSYDEAVEHERTCTGPPPVSKTNNSGSTLTIDLTNLDDNKYEKKSGEFSSATGGKQGVPACDATGALLKVTVWTCDVCRSAEFPTFEEAAKHEKTCSGKPATARKEPVSDASPTKIVDDPKPWLCDKCKIADFGTYEEAVEHEKNCPGKPKEDAAVPKDVVPKETRPRPRATSPTPEPKRPASQYPQSSLLDLSPLVRDNCDSPELYDKLSAFHAELLQHIDLVEMQKGGAKKIGSEHGGGTIFLRCHNCKHILPSPSSFLSFGKIILWDLFNHLLKCQKIPSKRVDVIKVLKPTSGSGSITLGDFLSQFFQANGVKEGEGHLVTLPNSEFLLEPGSRRDRWMKDGAPYEAPVLKPLVPNSAPLHNSSTSEQGPTSTGQLAPTPPDFPSSVVLPLIHKNFASDCSGLSAFIHFAMCQMNFHCNIHRGCPPGVYGLDLKCKHCGAYAKVNSRETLHKAIYSMTYSHLSKSCSGVPNIIRASLEDLQKKKRGSVRSSVQGGGTGVRAFCQRLIDIYDIVDIQGDTASSILPGIGIHQSSIPKVMNCAIPNPLDSGKKRQANHSVEPLKTTKRRKGPQDRRSDDETESFLEEDEDGNQFYIPPAGGVPLISTQSAIMATKLSRYHLLILDQLELTNMKSGKLISLRCQNCKADPRLVTTKKLNAVSGWHKVVKQIGLDHVSSCRCLSQHVLREIDKAQGNKKDKGSLSLNEYCDYLTNLYKMEDVNGGVVFGECEPIRSGYCGAPVDPLSFELDINDPAAATIVSDIPRHNLIPQPPSSKGNASKVVPATASKRMVLSDCNYIAAAQYKFIMVKRKLPIKRSRSPPPSLPDLAFGLRCQHCDYVRTLKDIRDFSQQSSYFLSAHLKKCPNYPEERKKELDELKDTQSFQKNETVVSTAEYARMLMLNIYGMTDLEWNGVSGGVGFGGDVQDIMNRLSAKYGSKKHLLTNVAPPGDKEDNNISWESFALPLILEDVVDSVSSELHPKLTASSSAQLDVPSSNSVALPDQAQRDRLNEDEQEGKKKSLSNLEPSQETADNVEMGSQRTIEDKAVNKGSTERYPDEVASRKESMPAILEQSPKRSQGTMPTSDMNMNVEMEETSPTPAHNEASS